MNDLADRARELFASQFGSDPQIMSFAPGRVNIIGEHTDYSGGFVFPAAIEQGICVAASPVPTGPTSLFSAEVGPAETFQTSALDPGEVGGWGAYPAGTAWAMREKIGRHVPNLRAVVVSSLPMGSGVSSSAALELAFAVIWNALTNSRLTPTELALVGQRAENGFVGVKTGVMDQLASALGEAGKALFIDTRSLECRTVSLPNGVCLVLADTLTPRTLAGSKYNERREQLETARHTLGATSIRDVLVADLPRLEGGDEIPLKRARHVVTENARCLALEKAFAAGDATAAGYLINESHASLRDDYEVSSPALDAMAAACQGSVGCFGARMTGAGFGGACIALVDAALAEKFCSAAAAKYAEAGFGDGKLTICRPGAGAHLIGV